MEHDIQIVWGSADDTRRAEIRSLVRNTLTRMEQLPCWRESEAPAKRKLLRNTKPTAASVVANNHIVCTVPSLGPMPDVTTLAAAIARYDQYRKRSNLFTTVRSVSVALLIALFPKCPVCWATYMSLLGFIGVAKIPYIPWLIYILAAVAMFNMYHAFRRARGSGNYFVAIMQLFAYTGILINWKFFGSQWVALICIIGLISASLVNNLRGKIIFPNNTKTKLA